MYLGTSHGALSGTIRRKCGTMTSPALLGFLTCRLRANRDLAAPGGTSVYPRRILRPASGLCSAYAHQPTGEPRRPYGGRGLWPP